MALKAQPMNNITIDAAGWSGLEQFPATITDLYEGEPIVLALKADSLPSQAVLHGQVGNAAWSLPISFNNAATHGGLSVYWARQKIAALMDETYKGGAEETIRKAVLDVALAHHLVSRYTSLVAVDVTPARPTDSPAAERDHTTDPARAQDLTALANLPRTATDGHVHILMGAAALCCPACCGDSAGRSHESIPTRLPPADDIGSRTSRHRRLAGLGRIVDLCQGQARADSAAAGLVPRPGGRGDAETLAMGRYLAGCAAPHAAPVGRPDRPRRRLWPDAGIRSRPRHVQRPARAGRHSGADRSPGHAFSFFERRDNRTISST